MKKKNGKVLFRFATFLVDKTRGRFLFLSKNQGNYAGHGVFLW